MIHAQTDRTCPHQAASGSTACDMHNHMVLQLRFCCPEATSKQLRPAFVLWLASLAGVLARHSLSCTQSVRKLECTLTVTSSLTCCDATCSLGRDLPFSRLQVSACMFQPVHFSTCLVAYAFGPVHVPSSMCLSACAFSMCSQHVPFNTCLSACALKHVPFSMCLSACALQPMPFSMCLQALPSSRQGSLLQLVSSNAKLSITDGPRTHLDPVCCPLVLPAPRKLARKPTAWASSPEFSESAPHLLVDEAA